MKSHLIVHLTLLVSDACNHLSLAARNKYIGFIEKMWSKREEILKMRGQPA